MLAGTIKNQKKPALTMSSYPGRDPRIARVLQQTSKRQFPIILFAILTVGFIAVNGALNASTGSSSIEKPSSFLSWILRNEGQPVQAPTPPPIRQVKQNVQSNGSNPQVPTTTPIKRNPEESVQLASLGVDKSSSFSIPDSRPLKVNRRWAKLNNKVVIERVGHKDTLSTLLQRQRIPLSTVYAVARGAKPVYNLASNLQRGKLLKLVFNNDNKLIALAYPISNDRTMTVIKKNDGEFSAQLDNNLENLPQTTNQYAEASFDSSAKIVFKDAAKLVKVEIRRGDYLTGVLARRNISRATAVQLAKVTKPVFDLARYLKPGNELKLALSPDGTLSGLKYPMDDEHILWVTRDANNNFVAQIEKKEYDIRLETISGLVRGDGSLFLAGKHAGLTKVMAVKLAALFEWDVDFARDIRTGDRFTVIREAKYFENERVREGDIIAAEFVNQGKKYRAVQYTNPEGKVGYFDTKGRSMRKMFIRAPVDFSRISSKFAKRRKHPVLGFTRAHKGTDFAASTGTPVRASGQGRVIFAGRKGGFGNLVLVRHNNKYTTAYAHLKGISKDLNKNSRVKQGQVIGQVGMTGTATGPHLHYEIRVNGRQVDPLKIQLPAATPVPNKYMADFRLKTASLLARLNIGTLNVASLSITNNR
ncbi:MAG: peptidoglycan DD-metalloendopeptidase family protein [Magnetococcales bacterium]|nr:peptidoglycan DD-metalloendopeptidase family protein [Magnetococcales bacterium]